MTRKRKQFERWRRFAAAVILAALYGMDRFSIKEMWQAARHVFVALTARRGRVDRVTYFRRLRCCWRCPVFYPPLRTCGSPLAGNPELGCFCEEERKAAIPEATCWIDENAEDDMKEFGWTITIKSRT